MCGAILTNATAWLAGIWFDLSLVGGAFRRIAYALPFVHGAEGARAALAGDWAALPGHLLWVSVWAAALMALAAWLFRWKMVEHQGESTRFFQQAAAFSGSLSRAGPCNPCPLVIQ